MDVTVTFRRLLLVEVLLAMAAFNLAEDQPGVLLLAGALAALAWLVSDGPKARVLPPWLILVGAMGAVGGLALEVGLGESHRVLVPLGHFMMWLQVLQLFARKSNRDYALILVLSLLQIAAACVEQQSMVVGALLLVYCALGLVTVLLFQFKATQDHVQAANQGAAPPGVQVGRPDVVAGRGYRWHFRMSMLGVATVCVTIAVIVFLLGPRLAPAPWPDPGVTLNASEVGASDRIQLGSPGPQPGNTRAVLSLAVRVGAQGTRLPEGLCLLRRRALDRYDPRTGVWDRGAEVAGRDVELIVPEDGTTLGDVPPGTPEVEADIVVRPGPTPLLLTLYPPSHICCRMPPGAAVHFNVTDQVLSLEAPIAGALRYTVRAPWPVPPGFFRTYPRHAPAWVWPSRTDSAGAAPRPIAAMPPDTYAHGWVEGGDAQDPDAAHAIFDLAQQILADAGLSRDPQRLTDPGDPEIAEALCAYLRRHYTYSLDHPGVPRGVEPVGDFLLRSRKGHCEQFASALAALARAAGLRARVAVGYYVHDYNRTAGVYLVRQNDAHAWTEIDCGPPGWKAFDPSPPDDIAREHAPGSGRLGLLSDLYDYIEFRWASGVVAYDQGSRQAAVESLASSIRRAAADRGTWLGAVIAAGAALIHNWQLDMFTYTLMALVVFFMLVGLGVVIRILVLRRRRLSALQLTLLPPRQRRRLSRQLGFYLTMLELLERYGFYRPEWQTPAGFARGLAAHDAQRFAPVVALTDQFYEVRFGDRTLDGPRQAEVRTHLRRLEEVLAMRPAARSNAGAAPA